MTHSFLHALERSRPARRVLERVVRCLVLRRLEKLDHGRLVIDDGGQRLGAMQLGSHAATSLPVIGVEWALVTPALVYLSEVRGLDGLEK